MPDSGKSLIDQVMVPGVNAVFMAPLWLPARRFAV
jgi:hypothetical protein